ncbi:Rrf2 family transcriptional regulator [Granulicella sp. WH15]|uniref:RrF2 family transcriptional regulator n=1 Tax=Granulicella sp. WH15 TaxID=2602070 RepID=UPI001366CE49|nr:Rrf2 family transcriptional regulator [Granulicella sp. WH15]QHN02958.1 Rrf2 family transcriptional regulator [Granulicella sp. WH15]
MAQSGRFELGLRVLALLAREPETMMTSAAIAEALGESAVMVRRLFPPLHEAGLIQQRKGPAGGAKLNLSAKSIGIGDVFAAIEPDWLTSGEKALDGALKRARAEAIEAMNETSVASVVKKLKKA